jgi:hypothetical protein
MKNAEMGSEGNSTKTSETIESLRKGRPPLNILSRALVTDGVRIGNWIY